MDSRLHGNDAGHGGRDRGLWYNPATLIPGRSGAGMMRTGLGETLSTIAAAGAVERPQ